MLAVDAITTETIWFIVCPKSDPQIYLRNLSMHKHSGFHHVIIVNSVMLAQRHHITENKQDDCKHPLLHESSCLSVVGNSKQYQSTQPNPKPV